jgi:hypothetical protein
MSIAALQKHAQISQTSLLCVHFIQFTLGTNKHRFIYSTVLITRTTWAVTLASLLSPFKFESNSYVVAPTTPGVKDTLHYSRAPHTNRYVITELASHWRSDGCPHRKNSHVPLPIDTTLSALVTSLSMPFLGCSRRPRLRRPRTGNAA